MRTAKTLFRLGGCPGWSESSLGAQPHCWFCHEMAHILTCSWAGFLESYHVSELRRIVFSWRYSRSVRVAERLALPTSDHGVAGSNHAGGEILPEPKRRFIAQSLSCSPFHRLEMTEILLKRRKTLTHPSIFIGATSWEICFSYIVHGPSPGF